MKLGICCDEWWFYVNSIFEEHFQDGEWKRKEKKIYFSMSKDWEEDTVKKNVR